MTLLHHKHLGIAVVVLGLAGRGFGAEPVRATLAEVGQRTMPPAIKWQDSAGRAMGLDHYRGKVVLLDFWATWCGGCKEELPWFAEFEKTYKPRGLSVVAVSLDEGGWPVVKLFLGAHQLPLKVLLDNGQSAKQFAIESMPVAVLIDRNGRIAAKYVGLEAVRDSG